MRPEADAPIELACTLRFTKAPMRIDDSVYAPAADYSGRAWRLRVSKEDLIALSYCAMPTSGEQQRSEALTRRSEFDDNIGDVSARALSYGYSAAEAFTALRRARHLRHAAPALS